MVTERPGSSPRDSSMQAPHRSSAQGMTCLAHERRLPQLAWFTWQAKAEYLITSKPPRKTAS